MNKIKQKIKVYDTTLRDGEQMPGVVFSPEEKIELASKIAEFGVDIIGIMPAISDKEEKATKIISNIGFNSDITAATMLRKDHIDTAAECGAQRVILFSSLSDIHLKNKLRIAREENINKSLEFIEYAYGLGLKVDFAGEDASRADINYVIDFINAVSKKVDYFLPCDTLGVLTPFQTYEFIKEIKQKCNCKIGMHVHNDFGQATANTLAGLEAGAELFSGTFNGIGERTGNAPIEEVVMALKIQYGTDLNVRYEMINEICGLVERYSRVRLQKHKPISGRNAFSHESGIHVDGILKYPKNYENFDPAVIGKKRSILFGKHSGKCSLKYLFGDRFSDKELTIILDHIKEKSQLQRRAFSEKEIMDLCGMKKEYLGAITKSLTS
ncbi:homoaconitate hydratase [Candidatus Woesearchaeota archaeon]|nr:homoaconitate hydratase [Candidatus Woesearchaeota archaeon]